MKTKPRFDLYVPDVTRRQMMRFKIDRYPLKECSLCGALTDVRELEQPFNRGWCNHCLMHEKGE